MFLVMKVALDWGMKKI